MIDWKLQRRQDACSGCRRAYVSDERHVSSLAIVGDEVVRDDTCVACWDRRARSDDVFHWFTRHRRDRGRLHLDLAALEQLFLQLEKRSEPKLREMRYVLSLLLMRKRRLRLVRVVRGGGGEALIVKRPRRPETFEVPVFDFAPERIEEVRSELVRSFEGGEPGQGPPASDGAGSPVVPLDGAGAEVS
jgi:hypothetical protein